MKIVFYTNSVSPHQLPLARELVRRVGVGNYFYIYTTPMTNERKGLGWTEEMEPWLLSESENRTVCRSLLETCDVLISGLRDFSLIESRCRDGKTTFYTSERWFKPIMLETPLFCMYLPGKLRMLYRPYRKMAKRLVALTNEYSCFHILPYGLWAWNDFRSIGVCPEKMHTWGYCVAPSGESATVKCDSDGKLRVLWVGRMIAWKRVDTLIRAVALLGKSNRDVSCTIVGDGPKKRSWMNLANKLIRRCNLSNNLFNFVPSVPINEVRGLMRRHSVYVLTSNACEGWGAVVNEAIEEGVPVVGTQEAGSSATILPKECQFNSGDYRHLAKLLSGKLKCQQIGKYSVPRTVDMLFDLIKGGVL